MSKKKASIIIFILFLCSTIISIWVTGNIAFLLSTIFTIDGIMFSIGLGLISNFSLRDIQNKSYLQDIRCNIKLVRNSFIFLFIISSISFISTNFIKAPIKIGVIDFNIDVFALLLMCYSILYFIYNFIKIQELNDDIIDRLLQEESNSDN